MSTVLVIQWADRDKPEVWAWPGEGTKTLETARLQALTRIQDRPMVGGKAWTYVGKCGTRRMALENKCP